MACVEPRRCAYFVKKRGRSCRMLAAKGSVHCGEHLIHDKTSVGVDGCKSSDTVRRRVPCPLDPSHTVFEDNLQKHLKKCNAAKKPKPLCYCEHVNAGLMDYDPSEEESLPLSAFSNERIEQLVKKVEVAYQEHFTEIRTQILSHPSMKSKLTDPRNGASALKHLQQQSSILAHLDDLGMISSKDMCYIEFGAGRGKMSECIQKSFQAHTEGATSKTVTTDDTSLSECVAESESSAIQHTTGVHYVLVDRESCRHKVDGSHRVSGLVGAQYHRLLMDIEHLDLSKLECLNESSQVVAVSKHLCGAATDLTLRCLVKSLLQKKEEKQSHKSSSSNKCGSSCGPVASKLCGVVIALCCHHRCSWPQLVGRTFFQTLGFTPVEFHLLCHMTSWAVCGVRPPLNITPPLEVGSAGKDNDISSRSGSGLPPSVDAGDNKEPIEASESKLHPAAKTHTRWGYVPHPNEAIGLKCKRLIDLARLAYLSENGLRAWLVYYVDRNTSLENVLLIAVPRPP